MAFYDSPSNVEKQFLQLREWLEHQPHLPENIESNILYCFLEGCKYNMGNAQLRLEQYYKLRGAMKEFYSNRDPEGEDMTKFDEYVACHLRRTEEGFFLFLKVRPGKEVFYPGLQVDAFKKILMVLDVALKSGRSNKGLYIVTDHSNVRPQSYLSIPIRSLYNFYKVVVKVQPLRIKGVYFINCPRPLEILVLTFLKPFLQSKLRDRLQFYSKGAEALLDHFPPEYLPSDFSGTLPSLEVLSAETTQDLILNKEWLLKEGSQATDESKRIVND